MKSPIFFLLLTMIFFNCNDSKTNAVAEQTSTAKADMEAISFDSLRAQKLGADQYGMKSYVFAFLKKGPNRDRSKEDADRLQRAHLDNIKRLANEGKLVLAGPFIDDGEIRGIYIFDVRSVKEAEELTKTDPAIQEGSLEMELKPWYGSAALMEVNQIHSTLAKVKI